MRPGPSRSLMAAAAAPCGARAGTGPWRTTRSGGRYQVMVRAVENSLVVGLYSADGGQAGFARFVTDYATFGWLCDVFVDAAHRGHGLGSFLVRTATDHSAVRDLRQVLATAPERTLYRRLGFGNLVSPDRWQERPARGSAR